MEFNQLIDFIMKWIREIQNKYQKELDINIMQEKTDFLQYEFESKEYFTLLMINEPDGSSQPHRYVYFESINIITEERFFYLDDENSSLEDIANGLNKEIARMLNKKENMILKLKESLILFLIFQ